MKRKNMHLLGLGIICFFIGLSQAYGLSEDQKKSCLDKKQELCGKSDLYQCYGDLAKKPKVSLPEECGDFLAQEQASQSSSAHKRCLDRLNKLCEGSTASNEECYQQNKGKLPGECRSEEVATFFDAGKRKEFESIKGSSCASKIMAGCKMPTGLEKNKEKLRADFQSCVNKNLEKHGDSCQKEFEGKNIVNF